MYHYFLIRIVEILAIAFLWRLGGTEGKAWARDFWIPILMGVHIGICFNWFIGLLSVGSYQIIRMGYGAYDPEHDDKPSFLGKLTKDRDGWIIRGLVGVIYALVGLLPLVVFIFIKYNILILDIYLAYALLSGVVGYVFCRMRVRDKIIERAIGASVASILLFI